MEMRRSIVAVCGLLVAGASLVAAAGPLEPPAGPIAPTQMAIGAAAGEVRVAISAANTPGDSDSLFKVTAPGSYYLTGNIQGVAGKHGIEVTASGVTIDLNGFEMLGVPGVGGSLDGIATTVVDLSNIAVKNGSIRGWVDGVDFFNLLSFSSQVSGLRVSNNSGTGLNLGTNCVVERCTTSNNGQYGISVNAASLVSNCTAYGNGASGISLGSASVATGCTAYFNILHGINASNGCTVEGNNCRINSGDGVRAVSACVIRNNTLTNNGLGTAIGAGVHTTGNDNRIEGNTCTGADTGIDVDTSGSLIIKNTCTGNTNNWAIASGNAVGAIVTVGTNSTAINGSAAVGSTLGTTDPFANFNY